MVAKIITEFKDRNRAEIRRWRQALDFANSATNPRLYMLQDLMENLSADGHLISQVELRKAATLSNDFSIINKTTGEQDDVKTELFNSEWFYNFLSICLDSVTRGFTLLELIDPTTMTWVCVPRRNVSPKQNRIYFEVNGDKFIDYSTGFERTLIHVGKPEELGLLSDLIGLLIWKRNAQQSWAEFGEKFGMPLLSATTNKTAQKDIDQIDKMLEALGEGARAVLPEGTTLDVKPFAGADAYKVYDFQIERINGEMSKPLTGGTMVSDNGSSRSQSEVHERNLDDKIAWRDKRMIEFVVNGRLMPIMQAWGWGVNPEQDKFIFNQSFDLPMKDHWTIVQGIMQQYEVDETWLSKTFNVKIIGQRKQPIITPEKSITAQLETSLTGEFVEAFQ